MAMDARHVGRTRTGNRGRSAVTSRRRRRRTGRLGRVARSDHRDIHRAPVGRADHARSAWHGAYAGDGRIGAGATAARAVASPRDVDCGGIHLCRGDPPCAGRPATAGLGRSRARQYGRGAAAGKPVAASVVRTQAGPLHPGPGSVIDQRCAGAAPETVLVLTPIKDAVRHLERYWEGLARLTYPPERISLGLLEGDSTDATFALVQARHATLRR